jgi:hypothetical protein
MHDLALLNKTLRRIAGRSLAGRDPLHALPSGPISTDRETFAWFHFDFKGLFNGSYLQKLDFTVKFHFQCRTFITQAKPS